MTNLTPKQDAYHKSRRVLTDEQVVEARDSYYNPPNPLTRPTIQRLAAHYNVAYNTMFRAIRAPTKPQPTI